MFIFAAFTGPAVYCDTPTDIKFDDKEYRHLHCVVRLMVYRWSKVEQVMKRNLSNRNERERYLVPVKVYNLKMSSKTR